MCEALALGRGSYYYIEAGKTVGTELENAAIHEFYLSRKCYGTRKLKRQLACEQNGHPALMVSRRRVGEIMGEHSLVSKHTPKHGERHKEAVNNDPVPNKVERRFTDRRPLEVVVSDLTYIKCAGRWHCLCLLLDLHGRKIIGSAVGRQKDAKLVKKAFYGTQADLRRISIFHTDRGGEFKNRVIDEIIEAFGIERSLSAKGTPIDNAVAESMYNIVKTEFAFGEEFADYEELELKWFDYANWYNNIRIHGSLGYLTPVEFEKANDPNARI